METIWADEVINETIWKSFVSKLLDEWNGLILWVRFQIALVTGDFDPQVTCHQSAVQPSLNSYHHHLPLWGSGTPVESAPLEGRGPS
jgi:hypothetical protein